MLRTREELIDPRLWFLATRPKTLTAAVVPVMVGSTLAYCQAFAIDWSLVVAALLVAILIQIGTNLVNDALDYKKGADTEERLGPARVSQMGLLKANHVLFGGFVSFGLSVLAAIPLIVAGGVPISVILAISILMGYLYTGGPYPLAYVGLGDLFVLLFFGLVGTAGMFYVLTGYVDVSCVVAGVQVGLLATMMIAINNLRDYDEDCISGKRTMAVRFGKLFVRFEIAAVALIPFAMNGFWFIQGNLYAALLPWLALPLAILLVREVWKVEPSSRYNQFLGMGALLHLFFGTLFSIGLVMG